MYLFSSLTPSRAKKSDLINYCCYYLVATIIVVGVCVYYIDQDFTLLFKDDDRVWLVAREITNVGLFTNYFIPAFIVWLGAMVLLRWNSPKNRERIKKVETLATWLMYCLLFSGLWVHIIKSIVGRQRPKISPDFDPRVFQPFITHWDYHSMPSGHAQVMFTVATFIAFLFPNYKYGFYFIAFAMAFTRVMTRDHFFSDVIMGIAVGHIPTVILLHWISRKNYPVVVA